VLGAINIENFEREHAYGESELRLLTTIAASLGTALENARLFDEIQRLLKITEERNAELAIINSIQQGLASKLDLQSIVELVGEKISSILNSGDIGIRLYDEKADLIHYLYELEHGKKISVPSGKPRKMFRTMASTQKAIYGSTAKILKEFSINLIPGTDLSKAVANIPIIAANKVIGSIAAESFESEDHFNESNIRLMETIAASMGVALENARLFDETQRLFKAEQQRAAELAVISSIQEGMAASLQFNAIVDLVGDKLREVFKTGEIGIRWMNTETGLIDYLYEYEHGERIQIPSDKPAPNGTWNKMVRTRQPIVFNTAADYGNIQQIPGTDQGKSMISVPIIGSDRVLGSIIMEDYQNEYAYSESDVRLLSTVAASMGVALENARLFDETQRLLKETESRNAELAIINTVQAALASDLNVHGIYSAIGEKIGEIFNAQFLSISSLNQKTGTATYEYVVEKGQRIYPEPYSYGAIAKQVISTRQYVHLNKDVDNYLSSLGVTLIPGTESPKSAVYMPLLVSDQVKGIISLQHFEDENAFGESDIRLLQTISNSMSVAIENARLFAETQRLLKETEERNAELAVINSIQQGLASKLVFQSIIDLIGDKIAEIFNAQATLISLYIAETKEVDHKYLIERGERLHMEKPVPIDSFRQRVVETHEPWLINENYRQIAIDLGEEPVLEGEEPKSLLFVPMIVSGAVTGIISLQNLDIENAFSALDVRLLSTIASAMSVALENARLFDETQRLLKETEGRNAELAVINSVQNGLAARLDAQSIYDLVGEKICELFNLQNCYIMLFDKETNTEYYPFLVDNGNREHQEPLAHDENGFGPLVMRTRSPIMINEKMEERSNEVNSYFLGAENGNNPKSAIYVPLLIGTEVKGVISVQNTKQEFAYSDSDLRLLTTLASSMSVALESARLFAETEQRAAELATVNTVSSALARELDISTLINLVGEQLRNAFKPDIAYVALLDEARETIKFPYTFGEEIPDRKYGEGITSKIIQTGEPLLLNQELDRQARQIGAAPIGKEALSYLGVPIFVSNKAVGVLSVQSTQQEGIFNHNDERLLQTIAANVGTAIHNAQLYKEAQELRASAENANQAKSAFLATMSHELRTPLNAIIGFTRIVRRKAEGNLPEKQTENLDKIQSSAEHLLGLINTILDIAKIESGRMEVQAGNVDISALADLCINLAAPLVKPAVILEKQMTEPISSMFSDSDKIKQIMLNLLSNAAKFTHQGRIILSLKKSDDNFAHIAVTDSGIGISEDAIGRIFEEFQQADSSTTRKYGGTGLGLAISRNLARLLGGDLTVTSELGKGSTFTLAIPLFYKSSAQVESSQTSTASD
jgi:GAF domain-containing protein